jgi:hypothetical protein
VCATRTHFPVEGLTEYRAQCSARESNLQRAECPAVLVKCPLASAGAWQLTKLRSREISASRTRTTSSDADVFPELWRCLHCLGSTCTDQMASHSALQRTGAVAAITAMAVIQLPRTYYHYVDRACRTTIVEPPQNAQTFPRPNTHPRSQLWALWEPQSSPGGDM